MKLLWLQDGIAPQCPVGNIGNKRAYIPSGTEQGFLDSYSISNYGWIFNLNDYENGYITPRK